MRRKRPWLFMLLFGLLLPDIVFAQDTTALPGQIAYVGLDQNVYTLNLVNNTETALTEDSSITRFYQWPTWANDGRLAYFRTTRNADRFTTEVLVSSDGFNPGNVVYTGDNEIFNYAYWSPQNCATENKCRDLAVLLSSESAEGLFIELVRDGGVSSSHHRIGIGAPFYFSWSPDGTRMLWQRNDERLDIFDVATNNITETLNVMSGNFRAPAWSPVDDRHLVGTVNENGGTTSLAIVIPTDQSVLASGLSGPVAFSWSPNGDYVAYTDKQGPLWIIDSRTGNTIVQSPVSGVAAFFWSPDSRRVAYVTLATASNSFSAQGESRGKVAAYQQASSGIAWSVLDIQTGVNRRFGAFFPTEEMLYMLIYFDQFAQSHRIWSPDSRYIIYSEVTQNNQATINLLDTQQSNAIPFSLADGLIGIWSFQ